VFGVTNKGSIGEPKDTSWWVARRKNVTGACSMTGARVHHREVYGGKEDCKASLE
jgi:hypothetical protein